jgi:hypothetical protein
MSSWRRTVASGERWPMACSRSRRGTTTTLLLFAAWQALVAAATLSARSLREARV